MKQPLISFGEFRPGRGGARWVHYAPGSHYPSHQCLSQQRTQRVHASGYENAN